jgi:hypothetical protein
MRKVPPHIEEFVTRIGGKNRFGGPNFRVSWGPDRLEKVGVADLHENGQLTFGAVYQRKYKPTPTWILEKWLPPEKYGSSKRWAIEQAYDLDGIKDTRHMILGQYPHRGDYEHCYDIHGQLYFASLEKMIRMIIGSRGVTAAQTKAARLAIEEKKRADFKTRMSEMYKDAAPAFYNPVSYAGQTNRTALMDRLDQYMKIIREGKSGEEMQADLGIGLRKV